MSSSALSGARVPSIQRRNSRTLSKSLCRVILEIVGQRLRGTKVAPELAELFQRLDGFLRVAARHDNDRIGWIGVLSETPPQPTLEHGREGELRLDRIENLRAGIDTRLDRVAAKQLVTETMDRGCGQFVQSRSRRYQSGSLRRGHGLVDRRAPSHRERFHSAARSRTARRARAILRPRVR